VKSLALFSLLALVSLLALAGCTSLFINRLNPGTTEITLPNSDRGYLVHVPKINSRAPSPLVIVLHGTGSNGTGMLHLGNFINSSEQHQYIVAAPNSLGVAFNEGSGRIGADLNQVDDTAFIKSVITDISKRAKIDPGKVFVVGFSSGAAMAQRLAVELDDEVKAVAAVSGHLWVKQTPIKRPRSMLLVFGTKDPLNPITGGTVQYRPDLILNKPSPGSTARDWARRLACSTSLSATTEKILRHKSWFGCSGEVLLRYIEIDGLGHYWAGGPVRKYSIPARVGPYLGSVDMTEMIWDFFLQAARIDE
jgi:polyhydroxybutyrate depolymerase